MEGTVQKPRCALLALVMRAIGQCSTVRADTSIAKAGARRPPFEEYWQRRLSSSRDDGRGSGFHPASELRSRQPRRRAHTYHTGRGVRTVFRAKRGTSRIREGRDRTRRGRLRPCSTERFSAQRDSGRTGYSRPSGQYTLCTYGPAEANPPRKWRPRASRSHSQVVMRIMSSSSTATGPALRSVQGEFNI